MHPLNLFFLSHSLTYRHWPSYMNIDFSINLFSIINENNLLSLHSTIKPTHSFAYGIQPPFCEDVKRILRKKVKMF